MTLELKKIAILTANGVNEKDVSSFQRAAIQKRCFPKVIGAGSRLITAWTGTGWGYNFAADVAIGEALGSDFDALLIPGGERAIALLQGTEHTKRIMNAFIEGNKPMVVMGDAVNLFTHFGLSYEGNANIKIVEVETAETDFDAEIASIMTFIEGYNEIELERQAA